MNKFPHLVRMLAKLNPENCWEYPPSGKFLFRSKQPANLHRVLWELNPDHATAQMDLAPLLAALMADATDRGWNCMVSHPVSGQWLVKLRWFGPIGRTRYITGKGESECEAFLEAYCRMLHSLAETAGRDIESVLAIQEELA